MKRRFTLHVGKYRVPSAFPNNRKAA